MAHTLRRATAWLNKGIVRHITGVSLFQSLGRRPLLAVQPARGYAGKGEPWHPRSWSPRWVSRGRERGDLENVNPTPAYYDMRRKMAELDDGGRLESAIASGSPTTAQVKRYVLLKKLEGDLKSAFGALELSRRLGQEAEWSRGLHIAYILLCGHMKRMDLASRAHTNMQTLGHQVGADTVKAMIAAIVLAKKPTAIHELHNSGIFTRDLLETADVQHALLFYFHRTHQPDQLSAFVRSLMANTSMVITRSVYSHALRVCSLHGDAQLCFDIILELRRLDLPVLPRDLLEVERACGRCLQPAAAMWVAQLLGAMAPRLISEMNRMCGGPSPTLRRLKRELDDRFPLLIEAFAAKGDCLTAFAVAELVYARGTLLNRDALIALPRSVFPHGAGLGRFRELFLQHPAFKDEKAIFTPPTLPILSSRNDTRQDIMRRYMCGWAMFSKRLLDFGRLNYLSVGAYFDDLFHFEVLASSVRACDPESFDTIIAWAPSLFWRNRKILKEIAERDELNGAVGASRRMETRLDMVFAKYSVTELEAMRTHLNAKGQWMDRELQIRSIRWKQAAVREFTSYNEAISRSSQAETRGVGDKAAVDADNFAAEQCTVRADVEVHGGRLRLVTAGLDQSVAARVRRDSLSPNWSLIDTDEDQELVSSRLDATTQPPSDFDSFVQRKVKEMQSSMGKMAESIAVAYRSETQPVAPLQLTESLAATPRYMPEDAFNDLVENIFPNGWSQPVDTPDVFKSYFEEHEGTRRRDSVGNYDDLNGGGRTSATHAIVGTGVGAQVAALASSPEVSIEGRSSFGPGDPNTTTLNPKGTKRPAVFIDSPVIMPSISASAANTNAVKVGKPSGGGLKAVVNPRRKDDGVQIVPGVPVARAKRVDVGEVGDGKYSDAVGLTYSTLLEKVNKWHVAPKDVIDTASATNTTNTNTTANANAAALAQDDVVIGFSVLGNEPQVSTGEALEVPTPQRTRWERFPPRSRSLLAFTSDQTPPPPGPVDDKQVALDVSTRVFDEFVTLRAEDLIAGKSPSEYKMYAKTFLHKFIADKRDKGLFAMKNINSMVTSLVPSPAANDETVDPWMVAGGDPWVGATEQPQPQQQHSQLQQQQEQKQQQQQQRYDHPLPSSDFGTAGDLDVGEEMGRFR